MGEGIRSYGPGKFHNVIDEYVYEACLNQGTPDEEISHEGFGWFALLLLDTSARDFIREIAADEGDVLTDEEQDMISESEALILHERSDGIVEVDWYDRPSQAKQVWAELEEELADDEDDGDEEQFDDEGDEDDEDDPFSDEEMIEGYVISDARGGGYTVMHSHKHVGNYRSVDAAVDAINSKMEREKFFPNIYYVNDHGNIDLLDSEGNSIKSRV